MAKQILLNFKDKEYTLEFTRKSIEKMESRGFIIGDIEKKPATTIPKLFHGAFLHRHPSIKQELTDEIYANVGNKEQLLIRLTEMYSEPIVALMENSEETNGGNVDWGASW